MTTNGQHTNIYEIPSTLKSHTRRSTIQLKRPERRLLPMELQVLSTDSICTHQPPLLLRLPILIIDNPIQNCMDDMNSVARNLSGQRLRQTSYAGSTGTVGDILGVALYGPKCARENDGLGYKSCVN